MDEERQEPSWEDKPLLGTCHLQIQEVADIEKYYQLLEKAGLEDSTEALIIAAQEQALSIRSVEAGVYYIRQDFMCRLCNAASGQSSTSQHGVRCLQAEHTWNTITKSQVWA